MRLSFVTDLYASLEEAPEGCKENCSWDSLEKPGELDWTVKEVDVLVTNPVQLALQLVVEAILGAA